MSALPPKSRHQFNLEDKGSRTLPGNRHVISANASKTKSAKLLAVFVVDTNETELTIPEFEVDLRSILMSASPTKDERTCKNLGMQKSGGYT